MPFFDPAQIMEFLFSYGIIREGWPFFLFIALALIAPQAWKAYIQEHYKRSIKWTLLELRIPRELRKTPKAMEQVFMAIHAVKNSATDVKEEWWDGEVPMWFSCEAVSFGGEVHLYMRIPEIRRNHIEAAIYAQYSDMEIARVEDYIDRLPSTIDELTAAGYKLFGNELILSQKDVYPILSYIDFESVQTEKELDPAAALLETLARIKPQEHLWLQILVRPKVDEFIGQWHDEGEKEIEKIKERAGRKKVYSQQFGEFVMIDRSPGDIEMMKDLSRKIEKPAFDVVVRYLYIAPADIFVSSFGRRSLLMALNQYASETYNKFKHNSKAWTLVKVWYWPHVFPKTRAYWRKIGVYKKFRERWMYPETFAGSIISMRFFDWGLRARKNWSGRMSLNVEELATIYHPPTFIVLTGPLIKREEARKMGPPAGLPIYGEGSEELPLK